MELDATHGDDTSSTAAGGADAVDERPISENGDSASPPDVSSLSAEEGDESPMALVERLRAAAEERSREVAKLREDTVALRDEIAQLREHPKSLIDELNDLRAALATAKDEISTRIKRAGGVAPVPHEAAESEPLEP